jgi:hypothetical protein
MLDQCILMESSLVKNQYFHFQVGIETTSDHHIECRLKISRDIILLKEVE